MARTITAAVAWLSFATLTTTTTALQVSPAPKANFSGGAGVGRLIFERDATNYQTHYDMVLVERLQGRPINKESGLFVPSEELPRLHLCRVVSVGPGREEENGSVAPTPQRLQVGDIVIAKNPWGIGPKDEETVDNKKLSYMRSQDIAAVIPGGLLEEEEETAE